MDAEKQPVQIAHIMGKMVAGGVDTMVLNYYRHINRQNVQFDFIIDSDSKIVPYEEITALGGRIIEVPPYQNIITNHRALVHFLREGQYRIVHAHLNALSLFPLLAAKRAGVPIRIAHSHSTAGKGELKKNILKNILRPFSHVFPTHFCACTNHAAAWLFGKRLCTGGKVKIIKNAIDLRQFSFSEQNRTQIRHEFGIGDRFVVGHAGRFMEQKNHAFLIEVFYALLTLFPDSVLLLVGEGELEQQIKEQTHLLGIQDRVIFTGVRSDVAKLMSAMDYFVLPSLYEGLGMVAVEAQACGLKVLASDQVPDETRITDHIHYMPLDASPQAWARFIANDIDCAGSADAIVFAARGYDIAEAAMELEHYYVSLLPHTTNSKMLTMEEIL